MAPRPAVRGERQAEMRRKKRCSAFAVTFYGGFLCHVGMALWRYCSMALLLYGSMASCVRCEHCSLSRSGQQTERCHKCVWNNMTLEEYVGVFAWNIVCCNAQGRCMYGTRCITAMSRHIIPSVPHALQECPVGTLKFEFGSDSSVCTHCSIIQPHIIRVISCHLHHSMCTILQECPVGTFKSEFGTDSSLCKACPAELLPHHSEFTYRRGA